MAQNTNKRTNSRKSAGELASAYRKASTAGKYEAKRNPKKKNRSNGLIAFICILIVGAVLAGGLYIYKTQTGIFPEGVTLAGVDVGGMTQQEAIDAITAATQNTYSDLPMTVKVLDSSITIAPSVSQVKLDIRAAVKAAFRNGKAGEVFDATAYIKLNKEAVRNELDPLGEKYSSTLTQSTYEVTGNAPKQELIVNLGVPEYGLDMNKLYQLVLEAYSCNNFTAEGQCEMIEPKPIALQDILDKYYIAPKDAYFDKSTGKLVDGIDGYGFDVNKAEKALQDAAFGSTVKIPFVDIPPRITTQVLTESLYKDVLATYTATEASSDADRNTNLKLACEGLNGLIINPGETFSFNKALGDRTADKGYRPGPSISGGKEIKTIGGGIAQVASNLYYCAMLADLEILSRENYGYAVSYVPLGMDAAVSYGTLDLCFKNTTSYPVRIEASTDGGSTTITLLGTDQRDYYVELRYEVLATYSYDTVYQECTPNNAAGYKDGDVLQNGHTGYSVKTYRGKYNKETKELIEEKEEAASYYKKADKIICSISGNTGPSQGIGNGGVTEADGMLP